jgi:hypothetical protein
MKLLKKEQKADPEEVLSPLMEKLLKERRKIRKFQAEHEEIFTSYDKLNQAFQVAENELKTAAKKIGAGYEDEDVEVEYTMPQHKFYDPKIVRKMVDAKILDSLGVIQKTETVDEKVLKALIRAKKVSKKVLEQSLVKEPTGAPRVAIKFKD